MEKGVKERLINFLNAQSVKKSFFEECIGASNGFVNSIRRSISPDKINAIKENFPDLNIDWLLTGDGEMLNTFENKDEISIRKYCLEKALEKYSDPKDVISASILFYEWITR